MISPHSPAQHYSSYGPFQFTFLPFGLRIGSLKIRLYRYVLKLLVICSIISASITYAVSQYYTESELKELYRKAGRRTKTRRMEIAIYCDDAE